MGGQGQSPSGQTVSKRTPLWLSAKNALSERSISASRQLGRGNETPKSLMILSVVVKFFRTGR